MKTSSKNRPADQFILLITLTVIIGCVIVAALNESQVIVAGHYF